MTTTEMSATAVVRWWKGDRGEWYVGVQVLLFFLVAFGPSTASWLPTWPTAIVRASRLFGVVMMSGGVVGIIAAAVQLAVAASLSALPRPTDAATLVDTGVFAVVRHPMYSGAICAGVGWALVTQSLLTLAYTVLLGAFFDLKASREERWLTGMFPGYERYRRRVAKLIPFVY
jgi:protein-S-isoprenylcysteine O-methyltransferase Ste14